MSKSFAKIPPSLSPSTCSNLPRTVPCPSHGLVEVLLKLPPPWRLISTLDPENYSYTIQAPSSPSLSLRLANKALGVNMLEVLISSTIKVLSYTEWFELRLDQAIKYTLP